MAATSRPDEAGRKGLAGRCYDATVTLVCWGYFTLGFVCLFSLGYLAARLFSSNRQQAFQELNSLFYRGFFHVLRTIAPRHRWFVDPEISRIRSAVVVCNHISYLDPILLISLFPRHKTIVKNRYFSYPIFGWVLRHAGYFPADAASKHSYLMIEQVEGMQAFLAQGGILFIFPEGRRSRDGAIGHLHRGAIKIARMCRVPIHVLRLDGTDRLFTPGRFLFNATVRNTISLRTTGCIDPQPGESLSLESIEQRIRAALNRDTRQEEDR